MFKIVCRYLVVMLLGLLCQYITHDAITCAVFTIKIIVYTIPCKII